ncbi:MAG: DNA primase [Firmicutes bacterium]|jgi:DNA primase|nr:DNA primase [Bacillota bacterium]HQD40600.1 DNA primase [Bacillota bacterium]
MNRLIPQELVDKIEAQTDLVELVSQYVKLTPAGKNLKGLCPFHAERTPSFFVNPEKQMYHCFGCGEGGGVFNFLMKVENIDFREAVALAGERCGISVEFKTDETSQAREQQELYGLMEVAKAYFIARLRQGEGSGALAYLKARGISPQTALAFELGFAPDSWEGLAAYLRSQGISMKLAESLGLVVQGKRSGYYDRFRKRLIFPIWDPRGRVIAFGGRLMEEGEPKYLNSPETPLFQKGRQLYALHLAKRFIRQQNCAVLMEGYMDVLTAHQAGFTNAVASLGTALTEEQARLLSRYAKKVILAYDADAAGQKANLRSMELLRRAGLQIFVASFPKGEDPDSLIRKRGADGFRKYLNEAKPLLDYKLSLALAGDLKTPAGKAAAGKRVVQFLREIDNPIEREVYLRQAAGKLGLSPESLLRELGRRPPAIRKRQPGQVKVAVKPAYLRAEEQLVCLMIQKPEIIKDVMHKLGGENAFSHPACREFVAGLAQGAAASELPFEVETSSAITVEDCLQVILVHKAKQELSQLEQEFEKALAGSIQLSKLIGATIKYKVFQDDWRKKLGRKEG